MSTITSNGTGRKLLWWMLSILATAAFGMAAAWAVDTRSRVERAEACVITLERENALIQLKLDLLLKHHNIVVTNGASRRAALND